MQPLDVKRTLKDLYQASTKVKRVVAETAAFLAVDGQGEPSGEAFQKAIQQLYSVCYTLKFTLKRAGELDFVVPPLEALWFNDPKQTPDMSKWHWQILLRIPDEVTEDAVEAAKSAVRDKGDVDPSGLRRLVWEEGSCLQVMHIGPYEEVSRAYEQLHAAATQEGATLGGPGHEIYLSDPRRTAPSRIRTIIRMALK
jgi:hypothetical protein